MINKEQISREAQEDFAKLKACKTPSEMSAFLKGRKIIVKDGGPFNDTSAEFIEMVGEGIDKSQWRMKVRHHLGGFLLLKGSEGMITFKSLQVTKDEADHIRNNIKP